jgi:hypothetical protein
MTSEEAPNPATFEATIRKYDITPATSGVTVVDSVVTRVALEVRTPDISAFDERNQRYPVMALPPLKGGTQLRIKLVETPDGFAERSVICEGTVRGVFEAVREYGPKPMTLLAAIWK